MTTNSERADRAIEACEAYAEEAGLDMQEELPTVIGDLIADLLHMADQRGLCAESILDNGVMHYFAELEEMEEKGDDAND